MIYLPTRAQWEPILPFPFMEGIDCDGEFAELRVLVPAVALSRFIRDIEFSPYIHCPSLSAEHVEPLKEENGIFIVRVGYRPFSAPERSFRIFAN